MLRITLAINDEPIADYEVKRVTGLSRMPGPDDVNLYTVRHIRDGQLGPPALAQAVEHRYGAGARQLAATVLALLTGGEQR